MHNTASHFIDSLFGNSHGFNDGCTDRFLIFQCTYRSLSRIFHHKKVGAAIMRNIRRIRILFASPLPLRELFLTTARALAAP
jgi:hypothetical protein